MTTKGKPDTAIAHSKDPRLVRLNELSTSAGRAVRSQFVIEGLLLVQRAVQDRLPVEWIVFTSDLCRTTEGHQLLTDAGEAGITCIQASEGLLGKVTSSRPVPNVVAPVSFHFPVASEAFHTSNHTILVAENINNPDNLGMTLRTADASGAMQVVVAGCDPFHKNCVRAARGAVGRLAIAKCEDAAVYTEFLKSNGVCVVGAALDGEFDLYAAPIALPVAVIVGNENSGITRPVLNACSIRVRIPMAVGQDSLNVGVAAGVMLYEVWRRSRS